MSKEKESASVNKDTELQLKREAIAREQKDPIMMAMYLVQEFPHLVRSQDNLYKYNGKCYDILSDKDIDSMFLDFCIDWGITKTWEKRNSVLSAFVIYKTIPRVEKMNDHESMLCLNNGILNIYTKEFIPHSPDYHFDSCINVDYDPLATSCPEFLKYLDHTFNQDIETISNVVRLGGYLLDTSCAAKKMFMFDGDGGCLDKDTFIHYQINNINGHRINHKGGSIETLYERFNNKNIAHGKGGYHLRTKQEMKFSVASINEYNSVFQNPIVDVVKSGIKKCYKLTTTLGKEIVATGTHKFYNGKKYISLNKLTAGDTVYIHNNTHYKNNNKLARVGYKEVCLKYHPSNHIKIVNGCKYYRVKRCRLVMEAALNCLPYSVYIQELNANNKCLKFLPAQFDVHHINKNRTDDRLENLKVMAGIDHDKFHVAENYDKMRFIVVPDTIKSIECVGKRETYDIKCLAPYNNFIADGVVVHNSGKSTLIDTYSMFFIESMDSRNQVTGLSLEELAGSGFDKALLINSRFNPCAETKKGHIDAEEIKKIISGDVVKVRQVYSEAVNFRPKTKIVVACNGKPKFTDSSDGISRRLLFFEFENQYKSPAEILHIKNPEMLHIYPWDTGLMSRIQLEKPSILNLFIGGLIDLRSNNYEFIESEKSRLAMAKFKMDSDVAREYLETNYEIDLTSEISLKEIFNDFRYWYRGNVQDSGSMKFRSAEMGKRIKETFKINSLGQKTIYNQDEKRYESLSMYNLKRKEISPDTIAEYTEQEAKQQNIEF